MPRLSAQQAEQLWREGRLREFYAHAGVVHPVDPLVNRGVLAQTPAPPAPPPDVALRQRRTYPPSSRLARWCRYWTCRLRNCCVGCGRDFLQARQDRYLSDDLLRWYPDVYQCRACNREQLAREYWAGTTFTIPERLEDL